jgi:hypothetical protein
MPDRQARRVQYGSTRPPRAGPADWAGEACTNSARRSSWVARERIDRDPLTEGRPPPTPARTRSLWTLPRTRTGAIAAFGAA